MELRHERQSQMANGSEYRVAAESFQGRRRDNQDCCQVWPGSGWALAAVADGMGGHAGGATASRIAIQEVAKLADSLRSAEHPISPDDVPRELRDLFSRAGQAIYDLASANPSLAGMGTTLVVALVLGRKLFVGHIGDSRAYIIGPDGVTRLTRDHSAAEDTHGQCPQMDLKTARGMLTRSLGDSPFSEPDLRPDDEQATTVLAGAGDEAVPHIRPRDPPILEEDEAVLLCSDGVWGELADSQLQPLLFHSEDANGAGRSIINAAYQAGSTDNLSVAVIEMPDLPRTPAAAPAASAAPSPTAPEHSWSDVLSGMAISMGLGLVVVCVVLALKLEWSPLRPPKSDLPPASTSRPTNPPPLKDPSPNTKPSSGNASEQFRTIPVSTSQPPASDTPLTRPASAQHLQFPVIDQNAITAAQQDAKLACDAANKAKSGAAGAKAHLNPGSSEQWNKGEKASQQGQTHFDKQEHAQAKSSWGLAEKTYDAAKDQAETDRRNAETARDKSKTGQQAVQAALAVARTCGVPPAELTSIQAEIDAAKTLDTDAGTMLAQGNFTGAAEQWRPLPGQWDGIAKLVEGKLEVLAEAKQKQAGTDQAAAQSAQADKNDASRTDWTNAESSRQQGEKTLADKKCQDAIGYFTSASGDYGKAKNQAVKDQTLAETNKGSAQTAQSGAGNAVAAAKHLNEDQRKVLRERLAAADKGFQAAQKQYDGGNHSAAAANWHNIKDRYEQIVKDLPPQTPATTPSSPATNPTSQTSQSAAPATASTDPRAAAITARDTAIDAGAPWNKDDDKWTGAETLLRYADDALCSGREDKAQEHWIKAQEYYLNAKAAAKNGVSDLQDVEKQPAQEALFAMREAAKARYGLALESIGNDTAKQAYSDTSKAKQAYIDGLKALQKREFASGAQEFKQATALYGKKIPAPASRPG